MMEIMTMTMITITKKKPNAGDEGEEEVIGEEEEGVGTATENQQDGDDEANMGDEDEEVVGEEEGEEEEDHFGKGGEEEEEEEENPSSSKEKEKKKKAGVRFEEEEEEEEVVEDLPPPRKPPTQNTLTCPSCGSTDIESHEASGASICTECGVVVEENAIVSSVEYVEGSNGQSGMVGKFVAQNRSKAYSGGSGMPGAYGFGRDSREQTLANGRRRIQDVASALRLGSHFVDTAHRLFTLAVEKNFTQGRRKAPVTAACLYIACRMEKSQHMLIDFSDALQVNVYVLGTYFLKLRRLLSLEKYMSIIDPALYVYRFAAHLGFDDKANAVSLTAVRLVGRMKRDWIVAGRRPAGICAAALLIAARAHGFDRYKHDVTKVLRVCGMTVANRLRDFERTPASALTLEQFDDSDVELEYEADPPIFTQNRIKEARALAIQENNVALLTSGALDDPSGGKRATQWREPLKENETQKGFTELYKSLHEELEQDTEEARKAKLNGDTEDKGGNDGKSGRRKSPRRKAQSEDTSPKSEKPSTRQLQVVNNDRHPSLAMIRYPLGNNRKPLVLPQQATSEELQPPTQPTEQKINLDKWKKDLPAFAADEMDELFRDDDEVAQKEAIFNTMNKEYIESQERKESERLSAEASKKDREAEDAAQAEGRARYLTGRRKRKRGDGEAPTTQEALLATVSARKISRKINYDAMSAIFDDAGSFSTDLLDDGPGAPSDSTAVFDPMFEVV